MAMLAEPRQRKRYNLMPKGKPLYEDGSRFGTKMLEKMGWKKGDGLGANLEGSKEFIRISYKNDNLGLGFEHRDDQWTQHEKSFNGLLKTLNNEENDETHNKLDEGVCDYEDEMPSRVGFGFQDTSTNVETKMESKNLKEKISGISLEEKSKQSKARVHYKKFTKGKDLAQYSEKDLANIFGKKAVDEQQINDFYTNLKSTYGVITEEANTDQMDDTINALEGDSEDSATKKKGKKKKTKDRTNKMEKENEFQEEKPGIERQTFTSSLSMQDYFKIKMEAIRNKKVGLDNGAKELDNFNSMHNDEPKEELKKKRKKDKKDQDFKNNCLQEPAVKKSKKNKRIQDHEGSFNNEIVEETKAIENKEILEETKHAEKGIVNNCLQESDDKKSKESENKSASELHDFNEGCVQRHAKKKSKKNKIMNDPNGFSGDEIEHQNVKKEKKSKIRDTAESTELKMNESTSKMEDLESYCIRKPAEKKRKNEITPDKAKHSEVVEIVMTETKSKKKKGKSKTKFEDVSNANRTTEEKKVETQTVIPSTAVLIDSKTALARDTTRNNSEKEHSEVIVLDDSDNDNDETQPIIEEEKTKKSKEQVVETSAHESTSTIYPTNSVESPPAKQSERKVNASANNNSESDLNLQMSNIEDLQKQYQAFNIYPISSFCAEKFRNINLNSFNGSSLSHIEGYGLNSDLQLDIHVNIKDEERITKLWKRALNKYDEIDKPKKTYQKCIQGHNIDQKTKQKALKLFVKSRQRKNAFQLV